MARKDGHFLPWANAERQLTNNQPTLSQPLCTIWEDAKCIFYIQSLAEVLHYLHVEMWHFKTDATLLKTKASEQGKKKN